MTNNKLSDHEVTQDWMIDVLFHAMCNQADLARGLLCDKYLSKSLAEQVTAASNIWNGAPKEARRVVRSRIKKDPNDFFIIEFIEEMTRM